MLLNTRHTGFVVMNLENAINFFGKNKTYLVSSNNYIKAKQLFSKYSNFYFLDSFSPIEELFIQSKCENNIITNSSFGWWSAWLNANPNKIVFSPKKWFKKDISTKDLYPNNWKVL